jgi:broad specificity phosphatase PhoE
LCARLADSKIELTEQGHQQALAAGKKLKSIIGDESMYVYMSPYQRSRQTWENIRKSFSPVQLLTERQDPRLREQEYGHIADLEKRPQELEDQKTFGDFFYRFSCGESGTDVYDRVSLFLDTLFREMDSGHHDPTRNIVIVSHGLFIRLFLMRYFRWNVEELQAFKQFQNCEICELTKENNGVYTLDGHTKPPTDSS